MEYVGIICLGVRKKKRCSSGSDNSPFFSDGLSKISFYCQHNYRKFIFIHDRWGINSHRYTLVFSFYRVRNGLGSFLLGGSSANV